VQDGVPYPKEFQLMSKTFKELFVTKDLNKMAPPSAFI
jgi:hypothetical protein